MKVLAICKVCLEDISQREAYNELEHLEMMYSELQDDGIAIDICSKGHRFAVIHQCQKFELLFESGALALIDGYPREAVSSFAVSLERMFEFYIRVVSRKHLISADKIEHAWTEWNKQSERQYGAFCMLYLLETKTPFQMPRGKIKLAQKSVDMANFRNKVVHHGTIPTTEEAICYGEKILGIMNTVLEPFLKSNEELIRKYVHEQFQVRFENASKDLPSTNQGWVLFMFDISHYSALDVTTSFEERLDRLRKEVNHFRKVTSKEK